MTLPESLLLVDSIISAARDVQNLAVESRDNEVKRALFHISREITKQAEALTILPLEG